MKKHEALAYLNLAPDAGESEMIRAFSEKFNHFQYLLTHAPNDLLRNIHRQNLDQLEQVRQTLGIALAATTPPPAVQKPVSEPEMIPQRPATGQPSGTAEPVAWLIRHTEQKSHNHHALWPGDNPIGRTAVVNRRSICIEDDPYVSRFHAAIIVTPKPGGFSVELADDGRFNQGEPSRNGTYLNGSDQRIKSNDIRLLKDGDTIQVGNTKFMLRINSASKTISGLVKEVEKTQFVRTVVIDL